MDSKETDEDERGCDFDSLQISPSLQLMLKHYDVLRPSRHQYDAIKAMLNSESILLQSKSGTGKTMSFCIAVVQRIINSCVKDDHQTEDETINIVDASSGLNFQGRTTSMSGCDHDEKGPHPPECKNDDAVCGDSDNDAQMKSETPITKTLQHSKSCSLPCAIIDTHIECDLDEVAIGNVVVVSPTRELAMQIKDIILRLLEPVTDTAVALVVGGSDWSSDINTLLSTAPNVVVATPGRLRTLFKQMKRKSVTNTSNRRIVWNTQTVVLDEADMLLDEFFIEQTRAICAKLVNPFVQVIAVSATFMKFQFKVYEDLIFAIDQDFSRQCFGHLQQGLEMSLCSLKSAFGLHVAKCIEHLVRLGDIDSNGVSDDVDIVSNSSRCASEVECANVNGGIENSLTYDAQAPIAGGNDLHHELGDLYEPVREYLSGYVREIKRIIVSASHVNRVALSSKDIICFTEGHTLPDVHGMKQAIKDGNRSMVEVQSSPVLKNISFYFVQVPEAPNIVKQISVRLQSLVSFLHHVEFRRCVVFCNQSHTRIVASATLRRLGFECTLISSRVSYESRKSNVESMSKNNSSIIVAADVMSRGVHVDNIDLVVNLDLPTSKEAFLHRSGRTGRYGKRGMCLSICTEPEMETMKYLEYALNFKCDHVMNVIHIRGDPNSAQTKREYIPDSAEVNGTTDSFSMKSVTVNDMEDTSRVSNQHVDNPMEDARLSSTCRIYDDFISNNEVQVCHVHNIGGSIRETLINCILDDLYPGRTNCLLPTLGVITGTDVYIADIRQLNDDVPPKTLGNVQVRFTECGESHLSLYMSQELFDAMTRCTGAGESKPHVQDIVIEQHFAGAVEIFNTQHGIFCAVQGTLLITIVVDINILQSLRRIISMNNVRAIISSDTNADVEGLHYSSVVKQLLAMPTSPFTSQASTNILDLFKSHGRDKDHDGIMLYHDPIALSFLRQCGQRRFKPLVIAYHLVTRKICENSD
ncbi:DEAD/DEAH box helicase domain containing protein [Babesia divergens]|uniref:ATP-dependent RNA helicase n=1 Tax=Babesia divergens TaxID=32595 RepID=A0AAD9G6G4_BABDI|nr:DEAD/DEAH box helicase domain containing protein [Babesia divergens]